MPVNVMLDLETYGLTPGSALRSIGAVAFDPEAPPAGLSPSELVHEFYANVDLSSCLGDGLRVEAGTVDWWDRADEVARAALRENRKPLHVALLNFVGWYRSVGASVVWAKPLSFDVPLIEAAMRVAAVRPPWDHRAGRDVRTLFDAAGLGPDDLPRFYGIPHHSLHDARHQARCVPLAMSALKSKSITLPVYGYLPAAEVAVGTSTGPLRTCEHGTFPYGECPACRQVALIEPMEVPGPSVVAWVTCDHGTFRIGECPVCHPTAAVRFNPNL